MPAPSNQTASTAIDLGSLPYSGSQNVRDGSTTYTVWHKFTAASDGVVGVFFFGDVSIYRPTISIHHGSLPNPSLYLNISVQNRPVQFPVTAGEVYYIKATTNSSGANPAVLLMEAEMFSNVGTIPDGAIFVNDDTNGFPLGIASADDDFTMLAFILAFPPGEGGDMLPGGPIMFFDRTVGGKPKLYDLDLNLITTINYNYGASPGLRAQNMLRRFYAGQDGAPPFVQAYDEDGNELESHEITGYTVLSGLAANNAGTILYHGGGENSGIHRWDLVNDVALSDLVGSFGATVIAGYDILVLLDDTIVFSAWDDVSQQLDVYHYDASGSQLHSYSLPNSIATDAPRLAYAVDDPDSFWVYYHISTGAAFRNIRVSDGTVLVERFQAAYEKGEYVQGESATPYGRFGISESCAFVIFRTEMVGSPGGSPGGSPEPDAIIGPLVWVEWPRSVPSGVTV